DDIRREVDVTGEDLYYGLGHLRPGRGFGDETHRHIGDGLQYHLLVFLGGDDHHRDRGRLVAQADQAVQPVHAGHVQVQQDQVQVIVFPGDGQGTVQVRGFQQFGAGKARCNDVADSFTEQWVIEIGR